jgi:hypothetical protein
MRTGPRGSQEPVPVQAIRSDAGSAAAQDCRFPLEVKRTPRRPFTATRGGDRHERRGQPCLVEAVLLLGRRVPGSSQSPRGRTGWVRLERSRPPSVHHLLRGVPGRWEAMGMGPLPGLEFDLACGTLRTKP